MTDDLHHLAGAYALDALEEVERAAFEAHYPSCEICSAEVRDFLGTAAILASATAAKPPAALRSQTMRQVEQTRQDGPVVTDIATRRRTSRPRLGLMIAAAAAFVLLGGFVGARLGSAGSDDTVLAAADAVVTSLDGGAGNLQVVWSAERDQVFIVGSGLDELTEDEVYELWFLHGDGVVKAALFEAENGMVNVVFDVADIDPEGFGVTIEPDGGSEQPTTAVIYRGSV